MNTKVFYKLIEYAGPGMPKLTKITSAMSLQYLKEKVKNEFDFFPADKRQKFLHLKCIWPDMHKLPKKISLLFLCNILRTK